MRALVLTHTFPPSTIANAKRPGYVVRGLLDAGWEVEVITSRLGMAADAVETFSHPSLRIVRIEDPVEQFTRRFSSNPSIFRAVSLVVNGLLWPDECALWSWRAVCAARRAAPYDCALAFVFPASMSLAGLPARLVGPRWVFDYQEPVSPQYRRHPRRSLLHRILRPLLARLERRALHKAGRVIFTADSNRQAYIDEGLVPRNSTVHVPYFYDAVAFPADVPALSPRFQIVYLGVFDWRGARNPEVFLRSLSRFLHQRPEARQQTSFVFHGQWLSEHNRYLDELNLRDVVTIQPPVPYRDYIEKLRQSPILLLVVAAAHNLFMPSKIVDYFGARRPILAFVPRTSEMRRVLEAAGQAEFACDELDVAAGAASLARLWHRHQSGELALPTPVAEWWSSPKQLPRYLEVLSQAGPL